MYQTKLKIYIYNDWEPNTLFSNKVHHVLELSIERNLIKLYWEKKRKRRKILRVVTKLSPMYKAEKSIKNQPEIFLLVPIGLDLQMTTYLMSHKLSIPYTDFRFPLCLTSNVSSTIFHILLHPLKFELNKNCNLL